jgi:hypothetical protein
LAAVAVLYAYRLIPMVTFKATSTDQGVIISTLVRKPIWAPSKAEVASSHELEESEKKKDESVEPLAVVELKAGSASANEGHQTVGRNDPAEPPAEKPQVPQGQTAEGTRTESARAFERGDSDGGWGEIPSGSLEWPAGQPISQSEDLANQTLFTLWGVEYDPRKNQWACDQANSQGLRCLVGNGGLDELKTFDRPAVLKLYNSDGRAFFATLKSLSGETATLLLGGKKSIVDIHEIALRWRGDYMLLWRPPPSYKGPIREGDSGPVVEWLYARLARLRGESGPRPDKVVFDRAMIEEVKKFQIEAGLKPDGMVGTRTLIRLGTEAESGVPLLVTRKENRG